MRKITLTPTPSCLSDKYKKTNKTVQEDRTERWIIKTQKKSNNWDWYELRNCLVVKLLEATQKHCAFCDKKFREDDLVQIEHFKPKVKYPKEAFEWSNLYAICPKCNSNKNKKYHEYLLKPDADNYQFNDNYEYKDRLSFELNSKNEKADKNIELYKLNRAELKKARKAEIKRLDDKITDLEKINYLETINLFLSNKPKQKNNLVSNFINKNINLLSYRNFILYYYNVN